MEPQSEKTEENVFVALHLKEKTSIGVQPNRSSTQKSGVFRGRIFMK